MILREFGLRDDSSGSGEYCGGEGVSRLLQFRKPLTCSMLSERRAFRPYGLKGGGDGGRGKNLLIRRGGLVCSLGGRNTVAVEAGDSVHILTPGGGGYGEGTPQPGLEGRVFGVRSGEGRREERAGAGAGHPVQAPRATGSVHNFKSTQYTA